MIPFASQRGLGQDLATHLQNELDNDFMEVAEVRGAVAQDLHGAFAEWELQADALTRCQNYLYSLSINPDPAQGELSREQYYDYIDRAENKLGLSGQPRAVVFHIKDGREHCHVVWSRIDIANGKAVQMAFDHDKLMMVSREFARDHGLSLPDGYHKDAGQRKGHQLSLYEQHQQRTTGISREQRMEQVTDAWRSSDSPRAFVQALAKRGYILATGKRPYVLVDLYGHTNALPKLIDDSTVRTKDIRAFLEKEFPPDNLPTVDEAKAMAAEHRKTLDAHKAHEQEADAIAHLKKAQAIRRQKIEEQQRVLRHRQQQERQALATAQRAARDTQRRAYLSSVKSIRAKRDEYRPHGLAAFLGRVTGVELMRRKLHKFQDRKRYRAYLGERDQLREEQEQIRQEQQRRHEMQALDLARKERGLVKIDRRELKSLEEQMRAAQRISARGGRARIPALNLDLKPRGRPAVPHKAKNRYRSAFAQELANSSRGSGTDRKQVTLSEDFERAAGDGKAEGKGQGSSGGQRPTTRPKNARRRRPRNKDNDRGR